MQTARRQQTAPASSAVTPDRKDHQSQHGRAAWFALEAPRNQCRVGQQLVGLATQRQQALPERWLGDCVHAQLRYQDPRSNGTRDKEAAQVGQQLIRAASSSVTVTSGAAWSGRRTCVKSHKPRAARSGALAGSLQVRRAEQSFQCVQEVRSARSRVKGAVPLHGIYSLAWQYER